MTVKNIISNNINDLISAQIAEASALDALKFARNEVDQLEESLAGTTAISAAIEAADHKAIQLLVEMINYCNIMAEGLIIYAAMATEGPEQLVTANALDKLSQMRNIFSDVKSEFFKN